MPKINVKEVPQMEVTPINAGLEDKVRSISLIVTKNCNLRCSYCYEKHDLRDTDVMTLGVAQKAIAPYLETDDEFKKVTIDFFGGEPFLAYPLIKDVVEWVKAKSWNKDYKFLIGTNGTILTDEMKPWLLENKKLVNIALSFDGTKKAHDLTRDNSYDVVRRNLPFFTKHWPHQAAKMTVSSETIPYVAESVIELEEMGLFFTANVGFEDMWGSDVEKKRILGIYQTQLARLVDYYAERPHLHPVAPMLTALPDYLGYHDKGEHLKKGQDIKRFCGAGHEMVVIDVDGLPYPCHRFLPWVTGKPVPAGHVNCQEAWLPKECAECDLILSCPTCAGFNWEIHQDTGIRTRFHCDFFKQEVLASAQLEAIRLTQQMANLKEFSSEQKNKMNVRLRAVLELIEEGI